MGFFYICLMKKQLNDLEVRIENLNKMLVSAIRYGEEDLQRMIRYKIEGLEREMKILKNKMSWWIKIFIDMITVLITIGFISLFFILMSVRLIFLKGGEFKGTCASQGNVCEVCGKKGDDIVCDKWWIFVYGRPFSLRSF